MPALGTGGSPQSGREHRVVLRDYFWPMPWCCATCDTDDEVETETPRKDETNPDPFRRVFSFFFVGFPA